MMTALRKKHIHGLLASYDRSILENCAARIIRNVPGRDERGRTHCGTRCEDDEGRAGFSTDPTVCFTN
ncbi:hypothetical protein E6O75_ATG08420 [Venturia nashicola]|uniref:Uncharacterized protein n=1 Tax=Venturia nashicola TaxID=86259 RepID=A0A4Z1NVV2_9PEZI|nr:hypothetical protein E6O75_ATG08420 [Venturia nashicola]